MGGSTVSNTRSRVKQNRPTKAGDWVTIAGACDQALDRMRSAWQTASRLKQLAARDGFVAPEAFDAFMGELGDIANILKLGLKGRRIG